jgi:hypothetical protein
MDSTINEVRAIGAPETPEKFELSYGMRIARNCALDELPGLAFGIMTVAYIVLALTGLTH